MDIFFNIATIVAVIILAVMMDSDRRSTRKSFEFTRKALEKIVSASTTHNNALIEIAQRTIILEKAQKEKSK